MFKPDIPYFQEPSISAHFWIWSQAEFATCYGDLANLIRELHCFGGFVSCCTNMEADQRNSVKGLRGGEGGEDRTLARKVLKGVLAAICIATVVTCCK